MRAIREGASLCPVLDKYGNSCYPYFKGNQVQNLGSFEASVSLQNRTEVMDVSCRSSLCTHVANDGISSGNRGAGPAEGGKKVAGRPVQLRRARREHASGAALQSPV